MRDRGSERVNIDPDEVAKSIYRLWSALTGGQPWEHISLEQQTRWYRVSRRAEKSLEALDGAPWSDAAEELAILYAGKAEDLLRHGWDLHPVQVAWNAVARHLASLLHGSDRHESEEFFLSWGRRALNEKPQGGLSKPVHTQTTKEFTHTQEIGEEK